MAQPQIFFPGDLINPDQIPTSSKRRLTHGLKHNPVTNTYAATTCGPLAVDFRKKTGSIPLPTHSRYRPVAGDLVIAQIRGQSMDYHHLYINAFSPPAILGQLAFENATKKSRPKLETGDLVYARVVSAQKNTEVELTCVNPSTGKADDMGPLSKLNNTTSSTSNSNSNGMVFDISLGLADHLLKPREGSSLSTMMHELGDKIPGGFEVKIGKNGRIWVDCPEAGVRGVIAVGRCLKEVDSSNNSLGNDKEQKKRVQRIVGEMGLG